MKKTILKLIACAMLMATMGAGAAVMADDATGSTAGGESFARETTPETEEMPNRVTYSVHDGVRTETRWVDGVPGAPRIVSAARTEDPQPAEEDFARETTPETEEMPNRVTYSVHDGIRTETRWVDGVPSAPRIVSTGRFASVRRRAENPAGPTKVSPIPCPIYRDGVRVAEALWFDGSMRVPLIEQGSMVNVASLPKFVRIDGKILPLKYVRNDRFIYCDILWDEPQGAKMRMLVGKIVDNQNFIWIVDSHPRLILPFPENSNKRGPYPWVNQEG